MSGLKPRPAKASPPLWVVRRRADLFRHGLEEVLEDFEHYGIHFEHTILMSLIMRSTSI
jgi:hypothetical protein